VSEAEAARVRRRRKAPWIVGGALGALALGLWAARAPIADRFIQDQRAKKGVPARYTIERIGLSTQRLSNVVIGNPAHPDLTARVLEVSVGLGLSGPYVASVRADGLRLYGRFVDGQLSLGALDKFRDPTDKSPFALPDMAVRLSDARARFETPWGNVGAALTGGGNLRRDFAGTLALVAPHIAAVDCRGTGITFYGKLAVRDVRPRLTGPLRGAAVTCGGAQPVAVAAPQIALDVSLAENLRQWDGTADALVQRLTMPTLAAERVGVKGRFAGTADRTALTLAADVAKLAGPDFAASGVHLEGKGAVGSVTPNFDGRLRFADASASERLRRSVAGSAAALDGTPLGPIGDRAARAFASALGGASGEAAIALTGQGEALRFELVAPSLSSRSGARFAGSADSRIGYLFAAPRPEVVATGRWTFGGGGLPVGAMELDRRADGRMTGLAQIDAYQAGGARLALDPVRFSSAPGAAMRFSTSATLSGPLAGGRVEGLRAPIAGAIAATGGMAFNGGCHRVTANKIDVSGLRLVNNGIDLCSTSGAPLFSVGSAGVRGAVRLPGLKLRGTSGASPFAFDSGPGEVDLARWRWSLANADVRIGAGDSVTHFAAGRLSGAAGGQGMAGTLADAQGKIGAVPLDMSEIAGNWRWADGALTLDGGLVLTDAAADKRFAPLISRDAHLRFADGAIEARAGFDERESGRKILDTVIRHRFADSSGAADLIVKELRFDDNFQPEQLTTLAQGVVANVQGSVVGDGRIEWNAEGVTSRGTFATANTDLAAAFGPVTGLTSTLTFDDLLGLHSAPGQTVALKEVNPGIPVVDGKIDYQLLGGNRVRIEGGRWPFAGGELLLHPATLDFSATQPRRLMFDVVGVDAAVFLQQFGFENINATGKFDGTLPVEFDGLGGRVVNGRIDARDGGGTLAYVGELSNHNLGTMANFAFGALRSLKYDDLTIVLNGNLDGEMVTEIRFGGIGQGIGAKRNFLVDQVAKIPLIFNIRVEGPFRGLIFSAKSFYDPSVLVEQNLSQLLQAQRDAEAAVAAKAAPVQPPASEPVQ
jgi:translocation and assembly module TamB